ncbi:hypothetical protein NPS01_25620 [Nocardioides psychrotolerans]|uniref:Polysaccharide deacetylase n=1 Tax=Nocardioides psychrotolerans TaxID=1005945 RepID=A0A1I3LRP4_9ACTN|nr:polysaccharide deacetylase family protein [Nocardioides psychrotolerans]GEP38899.1 hypothetical protein NPS01_25620 [Nocardioides psychrotolerans]SFI87373.1 Polysaccharide deacetylase [Nocardioides psychrotolerans]
MARSLFGGRVGDSVVSLFALGRRQLLTLPIDANGDPTSVTLQVWSGPAANGGVRYLNLMQADGTTATSVVVVPSTGQVPAFYGPDGINVEVWVRDPDGDFFRMDARADSAAAAAAAAQAAAEVAAAAAVAAKVAVEGVVATTGGLMTAVDADAGSLFRQQQDARHTATIAAEAVVPLPAIRAPRPVVCFTFDDCPAADWTAMKPILDTAGIKGGFVMPSGYPNAGGNMTWAQVKSLYDAGHEIVAHSIDHSDQIPQDTATRTTQINNRAAYEAQGVKVRGYAYTFGNHDAGVRKIVRDYYDYGLATTQAGTSGSQQPLSTFAIRRIAIKDSTVTATHYAQIDTAIANGEILVFILHSSATVAELTSAGGGYTRLANVIAYAQSLSVPILTPSQAFDLVKNTLDSGDFPGGADYTVVTGGGRLVAPPVVRQLTDSSAAIGTVPSAYAVGETLQNVLSPSPAGPRADNGPGVLKTFITVPGVVAANGQFNYQEFHGTSGNGVWVRSASSTNAAWSAWSELVLNFTLSAWTANLFISAHQRVRLPSGGLGYLTTGRTTRATWDATERDFWTFLPGGHVEQVAAGTTTWKSPTGINRLIALDLLAAGSGGNGGGSATAALDQRGGVGGGPGERSVRRNLAVTAATSYVGAVGTGGAGGAGGAAGGNNAGVVGTRGGDTTLTIGATTYRASGGNIGSATPGNSTATVHGASQGATGNVVTTTGIPGTGGAAGGVGVSPVPTGGVIGGSGGGPASSATSKGGLGGNARTAPNTSIGSVAGGGSATADGATGQTATDLGCGGGGGGGGCAGGAGGTGGGGADGLIVVEF